MTKTGIFLPLVLLTLIFGACSANNSGNSQDQPTGPAGPSGLTAAGSLGVIALAWTGPSPAPASYAVYRSTDGASFSEFTNLINTTVFTNVFPLNGSADGHFYWYRVTARYSDGKESSPTAAVRQMHGTRVPASYTGPAAYRPSTGSPYVIEGTCVFTNADVQFDAPIKLFVQSGSHILIDKSKTLMLYSSTTWFLGEANNPVTIEGFDSAGPLADYEGMNLSLQSYSNLNTNTVTGQLFRNVLITNIGYNFYLDGLALFTNCKFIANNPASIRSFIIDSPSYGPSFIHCSFNGLGIYFMRDMTACSGFSVRECRFTGNEFTAHVTGYYKTMPAGCMVSNSYDATKTLRALYMTNQTLPMCYSYWRGGTGTPPLPYVFDTNSCPCVNMVFDTTGALNTEPAGWGPDW